MKLKTNKTHDNLVSTNQIFEAVEDMNRAYRSIKKNYRLLRKYKKFYSENKISKEQYEQTIADIKSVITHRFEVICESGFYCGQGDECDWNTRAKLHAEEFIDDATK